MAPLSRFLRQWSTTTTTITTILLLLLSPTPSSFTHASEIGKPHDTVINLNDATFEPHLNDPANGLWFLKFYAPWCGHCKSLAPKLDQVAPYLSGKMAIGKIDCTAKTTKATCKKFEIRGYPTLKFYRDGEFYDYPGGRTIDEIIDFGEKMSSSAVVLVKSADEVMEKVLSKHADGVAFLAYDPSAAKKKSGDDDDEKGLDEIIQSTTLTQVFGQVARKMQAHASFGLLSPDISSEELKTLKLDGLVADDNGAFLVKIEKDSTSRPKLYNGEVNSLDYLNFVKENNVALVTTLGPHNFRALTKMGKPLAIGVIDPSDEASTKMKEFESELKKYALDGPSKTTDKYIFALMDGKAWGKFTNQFSVDNENLPDLFILEPDSRIYWQNSTFTSKGVSTFFEAVESGDIESRKQEGRRNDGPLGVVVGAFLDNLPFSAIALVMLIVTFFGFFVFTGDDYDDEPVPKRTVAQKKHAEATAKAATKKETAAESEGADEGKKDK